MQPGYEKKDLTNTERRGSRYLFQNHTMSKHFFWGGGTNSFKYRAATAKVTISILCCQCDLLFWCAANKLICYFQMPKFKTERVKVRFFGTWFDKTLYWNISITALQILVNWGSYLRWIMNQIARICGRLSRKNTARGSDASLVALGPTKLFSLIIYNRYPNNPFVTFGDSG